MSALPTPRPSASDDEHLMMPLLARGEEFGLHEEHVAELRAREEELRRRREQGDDDADPDGDGPRA